MSLIGGLVLLGSVIHAGAVILHVPGEYATIQAGIDAAAEGDTVLVADGTYTGQGNRDLDFGGKAIVAASANGPQATVIDCGGSEAVHHRGFHFHSGEGVASVVSGFAITHGYASDGGAILCESASSPAIRGNRIAWNTAGGTGGGVCCMDGSSPQLRDNEIVWNVAAVKGGGISCRQGSFPTIVANTLLWNRAGDGGGISCGQSDPTIEDNAIASNTANARGGGIYCDYYSWPTIRSNTIERNTAVEWGGGIAFRNYTYGSIEGNTLAENRSVDGGGGIFCECSSPRIDHNTIARNESEGSGGGILCFDWSLPTLDGNTITANTAASGGAIACTTWCHPTVKNSILWADSAGEAPEILLSDMSSLVVTYSDVEGGWAGVGNIDADPTFVLAEKRDYRLLWDSPCVDAGHPDSLDPDGTRRDMGSHFFDQDDHLTIYLTPDATEIARGSGLGVTYTVMNRWPGPQPFWAITEAILPDGDTLTLLGPTRYTLPGETTVRRHLSQTVPLGAPPGGYEYHARIGVPPSTLYDEDRFELTVRHPPRAWRVPEESPTIQAGVDSAAGGDTVLVADGIYTGDGNRDVDFRGKAIVVMSENGPEATIIDCEGSSSEPHRAFLLENGEDSTSVLEGFTIRNGRTNDGGGVYCWYSSPTLRKNKITDSYAVAYGGGISCELYASPAIEENVFVGNYAIGGAAVGCEDHCAPRIACNTMTDGDAGMGGAIHTRTWCSPQIVGNTMADNNATWEGGAIYCKNDGSVVIIDNLITGNVVSNGSGGGISVESCDSLAVEGNTITGNESIMYDGGGISFSNVCYAIIAGNRIAGNICNYEGGGIDCAYYSPLITGNVIEGNVAGAGGGISSMHAHPTLEGNTITGNVANSGGGICASWHAHFTVKNCIVWGDSAVEGLEIHLWGESSISVDYSDVEAGSSGVWVCQNCDLYWGEGNIDLDPLFVTGPLGEYYLSQIAAGQPEDSPCVDAGDPDSPVPEGTTRTDEVPDAWPTDMGYHYAVPDRYAEAREGWRE